MSAQCGSADLDLMILRAVTGLLNRWVCMYITYVEYFKASNVQHANVVRRLFEVGRQRPVHSLDQPGEHTSINCLR